MGQNKCNTRCPQQKGAFIIVNSSKRDSDKSEPRVDWVSSWGSSQIGYQIHISGRDQNNPTIGWFL